MGEIWMSRFRQSPFAFSTTHGPEATFEVKATLWPGNDHPNRSTMK